MVIVHDFLPKTDDAMKTMMEHFRTQQWTTFQVSGLVMVVGKLDKNLDTSNGDLYDLLKFMKAATDSVTSG